MSIVKVCACAIHVYCSTRDDSKQSCKVLSCSPVKLWMDQQMATEFFSLVEGLGDPLV